MCTGNDKGGNLCIHTVYSSINHAYLESTLPRARGATAQQTGGYCWSIPFKVLGVLFLGEICSAFLPSKKACWAHQFRYLGDDQQYPPVKCTQHWRGTFPSHTRTETQSRNQCHVGGWDGRFLDTHADSGLSSSPACRQDRAVCLRCNPRRLILWSNIEIIGDARLCCGHSAVSPLRCAV